MAKKENENLLKRDFVIGVVAGGLALALASLVLWQDAVQADGHSATRSFAEPTVAPGGEIEVTIAVADHGGFGQVAETLPDGFSYVSTSLEGQDSVSGQTVTFTLLGDDSVTYTVTASDVAGTYSFEGVVRDSNQDERMVGGDSTVTVEIETVDAEANRSLSTDEVLLGEDGAGNVVVTIAAEYGMFGQIVEMVPAGFRYVRSSHPADAVSVNGQTITFTLLGESSVAYTVSPADTPGSYSFSGVLTDEDRMEHGIGGDSTVTIRYDDPLRDTLLPPTGGPAMPGVVLLGVLVGAMTLLTTGWVLTGRRARP